ncbi:DUF6075 family protein [Priestia aryabhattai]|uniref:DUF6075 family protein n=1 Tax=Priestia aryabhattai TaxID=412384 RepID=UPI001C22B820|nr:hypothetical protein [Bacillus sp. FJAT-26377]
MNFEFMSNEHAKEFQEMRNKIKSRLYRNDAAYLGIIYLITGNERLYSAVSNCLNVPEGTFNSEYLSKDIDLDSDLSTLFHLMTNIYVWVDQSAVNKHIEPIDIISLEDEDNFKLVLNAMKLVRYGMGNLYELSQEKFYC